MSIEQLIATQYNRNAPTSPLQTLAGIESIKGQQLQRSMIEGDMQQKSSQRGLAFAANIKSQIDNAETPEQKQQIYATAMDIAKRSGYDLTGWPGQYDDRANTMLDVAYMQTYNPAQLEAKLRSSGIPAGQREFQSYMNILRPAMRPDGTIDPSTLNAEQRAAAIKLRIIPGAMGSAAQTIASQGTTQQVGESEARMAGMRSAATERGSLGVRGEMMPEIVSEETTAKLDAEEAAESRKKQKSAKLDLVQVDTAYDYLKDRDMDKIYGAYEGLYPDFARSQEGKDMKRYMTQLVAQLKLASRQKIAGQGAITDPEAQTLEVAATLLGNFDISPEVARKQLEQAMDIFYRSAGEQRPSQGAPAKPEKYELGKTYEFNGYKYKMVGGDAGNPVFEEIE